MLHPLCSSALAALALCSAFPGTSAAADLTRSFPVGVNGCDNAATDQLCTPVPTVALPTDGVLRVAFDAATTHCSSIIAHLLVDGVEQFASGSLAPGQGTGVQDFGAIAAGVHAVGVQAEGVLGGCNSGSLATWAGTLALTVSGVTEADAAIAAPGDSVSVSTLVSGSPAPAAVEASYTRPLDTLGFATLSAATYYPPDPIIPPNSVIPGIRFYPGDPYRLAFWDGAAWSPVFSSDGAPPPYTTASGDSVDFTATSTPRVTALGGTVFAFVGSFGLVGFEPPVDNDALNVTKAGRAIPIKWRLYDLGGNPVTDRTPATVKLTSVSVACAG